MSKDKILRVVLPVAAAVVVVCVLCILFLTQCRSGGDTPVIDTDNTAPTTAPTVADDVEVSDRKDFDWRSEAGNGKDKDEGFNTISDATKPNGNSDSSKDEANGVGLRHDESKNGGQEADFASWDTTQP